MAVDKKVTDQREQILAQTRAFLESRGMDMRQLLTRPLNMERSCGISNRLGFEI